MSKNLASRIALFEKEVNSHEFTGAQFQSVTQLKIDKSAEELQRKLAEAVKKAEEESLRAEEMALKAEEESLAVKELSAKVEKLTAKVSITELNAKKQALIAKQQKFIAEEEALKARKAALKAEEEGLRAEEMEALCAEAQQKADSLELDLGIASQKKQILASGMALLAESNKISQQDLRCFNQLTALIDTLQPQQLLEMSEAIKFKQLTGSMLALTCVDSSSSASINLQASSEESAELMGNNHENE
jgi:hypothetical protein